jgi:hypothetical protein
MWVTLTAYFACILIGGYAGLCLGYFSCKEEFRNEILKLSSRSRSNAESQPAATIQSEDGVFAQTERTAETQLRAKRRAA